MTDLLDLPFSVEYRTALEHDRKKFREACHKLHSKAIDTADRIRAITLLAPGEAEVRCKCGVSRTARSRPPGKSGQLGGSMNQFWKEHLRTCTLNAPALNERVTDEDGMKLFYPCDFPMSATKLGEEFPSHERDCVVNDILNGHVPVRAHGESLPICDFLSVICTNIEERSRQLKEAMQVLECELDKMRPSPDQEEDERVLTVKLHAALELARLANPMSYKVMLEHALGTSPFALCIVYGHLNNRTVLSETFENDLEAHLRRHLRSYSKATR